MTGLAICLWFDTQAEEAANFYVSAFRACGRTAMLGGIVRNGEAGPGPSGGVLTVEFVLDGQEMLALNGGPMFKHSPAVAIVVKCTNQAEIDGFWERLADGGSSSRCGWLTDKFGVSWQIVPATIGAMMLDPDPARVARVIAAFTPMTKLDIATIERAFDGA